MNAANYASLEASKRLVSSGIVLETDLIWLKDQMGNWILVEGKAASWQEHYPAPCMAEVWRELPEANAYLHTTMETEVFLQDEDAVCAKSYSFASFNPTDALIDLLIWVRDNK